MSSKNAPFDGQTPLLEEPTSVRFSADHIAGFQRIRRELFHETTTLRAVIRYCAIAGQRRELNRLSKRSRKEGK